MSFGRESLRIFFGGPWDRKRFVGETPERIDVEGEPGFYEKGHTSDTIAQFVTYRWKP